MVYFYLLLTYLFIYLFIYLLIRSIIYNHFTKLIETTAKNDVIRADISNVKFHLKTIQWDLRKFYYIFIKT